MVCSATVGLASVSTDEYAYSGSVVSVWRPPSREFVEQTKGINDTAY